MRLRALAVTTALALAVTGLTACTSKVGQAAVVGSHRISTKDVDRYINSTGPTAAALAQGQTIAPRVLVLETMIEHDLFLGALKKTKAGAPTADQLRAAHDTAAASLTQGQLTGAAFDKALNGQLTEFGVRVSFAATYIQTQELGAILSETVKATTNAEFLAAIAKAKLSVSVSPRYGSWDATNFDLATTAKSGRPPFVTIGSDTAASATPAAGQ